MSTIQYSPAHIANFFLSKAGEEGISLTQMKLMKLVYIAYGWALALLGRPIFSEKVQAWKHGPVIPSLYHEFKHFGADPIDRPAKEFDLEEFEFATPQVDSKDEELGVVLDRVWNVYKHFTAGALRAKTHERGTPWSEVYKEGEMGVVIPDESIKAHFEGKIRDYLNG